MGRRASSAPAIIIVPACGGSFGTGNEDKKEEKKECTVEQGAREITYTTDLPSDLIDAEEDEGEPGSRYHKHADKEIRDVVDWRWGRATVIRR